jgi:hypothetical protein
MKKINKLSKNELIRTFFDIQIVFKLIILILLSSFKERNFIINLYNLIQKI